VQFLVFLTAVWLLWRHVTGTDAARKNLLLLASYVFYASWDLRFLPVVVGTTLVQWWLGARIAASASRRARRAWLTLSIGCALVLLGYFKYAGFSLNSSVRCCTCWGSPASRRSPRWPRPSASRFFLPEPHLHDRHPSGTWNRRAISGILHSVCFFGHVTAGPIRAHACCCHSCSGGRRAASSRRRPSS
jgi:hypothetical protein